MEFYQIVYKNQEDFQPLIHHQNAACGVAFSPMALRRMPNTPQALGLVLLASDILLVIRKLAE